MTNIYKPFLDKIKIELVNHGHSMQSVLTNSAGELTTNDPIINDICASLYFCEEYTIYSNLKLLAYVISDTIKAYKTNNVDVYDRSYPIIEVYHNYRNDRGLKYYMDLYSYCVFDLYNSYDKESVMNAFNRVCKFLKINNVKFDDVLPNYDLVKNGEELKK